MEKGFPFLNNLKIKVPIEEHQDYESDNFDVQRKKLIVIIARSSINGHVDSLNKWHCFNWSVHKGIVVLLIF